MNEWMNKSISKIQLYFLQGALLVYKDFFPLSSGTLTTFCSVRLICCGLDTFTRLMLLENKQKRFQVHISDTKRNIYNLFQLLFLHIFMYC